MIIQFFTLAAFYIGSSNGQFGGGFGGGGGCQIDQKCYVPCPDYTLADAFPFIRQTPISCDECQRLCNKLQAQGPPFVCASAVYDSTIGSCDIFAVADQSGGGGGGGGDGGFRRAKRNGNGQGDDSGNGGGGGGGGNGGRGKTPHKQKYPGRIYLQPTGFCAGQGGNDTQNGGSSGSSGGSADTTTTASTTTSTTSASAKKRFKDMKNAQRDSVRARCIAGRHDGVKNCNSGVTWTATGRRISCVPTKEECDRS